MAVFKRKQDLEDFYSIVWKFPKPWVVRASNSRFQAHLVIELYQVIYALINAPNYPNLVLHWASDLWPSGSTQDVLLPWEIRVTLTDPQLQPRSSCSRHVDKFGQVSWMTLIPWTGVSIPEFILDHEAPAHNLFPIGFRFRASRMLLCYMRPSWVMYKLKLV